MTAWNANHTNLWENLIFMQDAIVTLCKDLEVKQRISHPSSMSSLISCFIPCILSITNLNAFLICIINLACIH